ncbi:hypothetical protein [Paludisphaera mucosa]|uniref:Uncharacterized protein n=1 Tax=Paludisphaera mucosa TaxID=3030827 RepID=A0ABT6F7Q6_9BACT|nr:hypothetical protein [Paludisphaera mucosa]MDG3003601.1 hypothetical protein [Paludisphaera mucosa]
MSESEADQTEPNLASALDENGLLALDVPAFVRRGQDVEFLISSLHERCRRHRLARLDMVHVRLRQWAKVATGPGDWADAFLGPIDGLWPLAEAESPAWSRRPGSPRQRRAIARDLVASVERFNERWAAFVARLDIDLVNTAIEHYNAYYVIEKECVLGSARLAAMFFTPLVKVSAASLLADHPPLPVPEPNA